MTGTFGNKHWRRPCDNGRAHSNTEASDCLLLLFVIAAGVVLGVLLG